MIQTMVDWDNLYVGSNVAYLCSGRELYANSYLIGLKKNVWGTTPDTEVLAMATYGSTQAFYGFSSTAADNDLVTSRWDYVIATGTRQGKGVYHTHFITADTDDVSLLFDATNTAVMTDTTVCASGLCTL